VGWEGAQPDVCWGGRATRASWKGSKRLEGSKRASEKWAGSRARAQRTAATSRPSHEDVGQAPGLPTPGLAHARMRPRPMALLAAFPKLARPQILVRTAPETLEYDPARHGEQAMLPVHQASPSAVLAEGCSRLLELERK
jgi:hypothetical protein